VAEWSRAIALERGSPEFSLSHTRLVQLENGRSAPSIQKLFSLSVIYGVALGELLGTYLNLDSARRLHGSLGLPDTHLVSGDDDCSLLEHFHDARHRYGLIGSEDHTMDPLIRPGSLVQIDESEKPSCSRMWRNEFERPVYFLETRGGYVCSWCDLGPGQIISLPHPLSPCRAHTFAHPREAEVIGRVTAVAGRISVPG